MEKLDFTHTLLVTEQQELRAVRPRWTALAWDTQGTHQWEDESVLLQGDQDIGGKQFPLLFSLEAAPEV